MSNDPLNPPKSDRQLNREAFLTEYKKLCEKHMIRIAACGCCDSPWLISADLTSIDCHVEHLLETDAN